MTKFIVDALDYLFGFNPPVQFGLQWVVWGFVAAGLLLAFVLIFVMKTTKNTHLKKVVQEYPSRLITISFLLLINVFSRFNRIEVLSMRFITFVLLTWLIYYFFQIFHGLTVKFPEKNHLHEDAVENREKKYHIHKNKGRKTQRR